MAISGTIAFTFARNGRHGAERDIRLGRQRGISLGGEHALGRRLGDDVDLIVQRRQCLPIGFGFGRDPDCGSGVQHYLQVRAGGGSAW